MNALAALVRDRALTFGDYVLKSGARSTFYLDLRALHLSPAVRPVVDELHDLLVDFEFDAIGGPCVGADPIVGAYLYAQGQKYPDLRGFLVRKEEKGHGLAGLVIGSVRPGDRCVVVEDVATTGGSALRAVRAVRAFGAEVVAVVAVVDRSGGAAKALLMDHMVHFRSLLTLADLGVEADGTGGGA